jgi:hypothetical protein
VERRFSVMTIYRTLHKSKTHAQGNDPNCPICRRHIAVAETIKEVGATHLFNIQGPNDSDLGFYNLPNGRVFIVQNYKDDNGFEIYAAISHNSSTQATLDMLRQLATVTR